MRLMITKSNIFLRAMFLITNHYFFTFARMKAQQNRPPLHKIASKSKPFSLVLLLVCVIAEKLHTLLLYTAGNGHEKLQIQYANLRV
jgi:hypothetical protein